MKQIDLKQNQALQLQRNGKMVDFARVSAEVAALEQELAQVNLAQADNAP